MSQEQREALGMNNTQTPGSRASGTPCQEARARPRMPNMTWGPAVGVSGEMWEDFPAKDILEIWAVSAKGGGQGMEGLSEEGAPGPGEVCRPEGLRRPRCRQQPTRPGVGGSRAGWNGVGRGRPGQEAGRPLALGPQVFDEARLPQLAGEPTSCSPAVG